MGKASVSMQGDTTNYHREAEGSEPEPRGRKASNVQGDIPPPPDALGMDGDSLENLESAVQGKAEASMYICMLAVGTAEAENDKETTDDILVCIALHFTTSIMLTPLASSCANHHPLHLHEFSCLLHIHPSPPPRHSCSGQAPGRP
jgi:hypothetical protein